MIDCSKAGQMMEQIQFEKIGWWKKRKLKLHVKMCNCCKDYENDNRILAQLIKIAGVKHCDTALSEQEKQDIKSKLAEPNSLEL